MSSAAFPFVISAVLTVAEGAVSARVVRGRDFAQNPSDVVMIGIQNIEDTGLDSAGSFQQTMQTFGGNREEVGTVNCVVLARDGGADQSVTCAAAFGYIAAIEAAVRADPTLGLSQFEYVVAEMAAGDVAESQERDLGAITAITFVIAYKIRI